MLAIFFECEDQEMAAKILGEYLRAYRRYTDNTVLTVAQGERKFVEEQLSKSKSELEESGVEADRFRIRPADREGTGRVA